MPEVAAVQKIDEFSLATFVDHSNQGNVEYGE